MQEMGEIKSLFSALESKIDKKFERLDNRLNIIDSRLNTIDSRLNTIDNRLFNWTKTW